MISINIFIDYWTFWNHWTCFRVLGLRKKQRSLWWLKFKFFVFKVAERYREITYHLSTLSNIFSPSKIFVASYYSRIKSNQMFLDQVTIRLSWFGFCCLKASSPAVSLFICLCPESLLLPSLFSIPEFVTYIHSLICLVIVIFNMYLNTFYRNQAILWLSACLCMYVSLL